MNMIARCVAICCLAIVACQSVVTALYDPNVPRSFIPFGSDVGDTVAPVNNDGSTASIPINGIFRFYGDSYSNLYVNTNGAISFGSPVPMVPTAYPINSRVIAPYWCDIDTTANNGRIYYKASTDSNFLYQVSRMIKSAGGINAVWAFIATWHNVTYHGGNSLTPVNTFQVVLMAFPEKITRVVFNYGILTWATERPRPQVGLFGDSSHCYTVPKSGTPEVINVYRGSNYYGGGQWVFTTDDVTISPSNTSVPYGYAVNYCECPNPCLFGNLPFYSIQNNQVQYIQCGGSGQCYVMACPSGFVWDSVNYGCTYPARISSSTTTTTAQPGGVNSGVYNCQDRNPCSSQNYNNGLVYFPNDNPAKYVQCDAGNRCNIMACPSGLVWDAGHGYCNYPPAGKRRRRSNAGKHLQD